MKEGLAIAKQTAISLSQQLRSACWLRLQLSKALERRSPNWKCSPLHCKVDGWCLKLLTRHTTPCSMCPKACGPPHRPSSSPLGATTATSTTRCDSRSREPWMDSCQLHTPVGIGSHTLPAGAPSAKSPSAESRIASQELVLACTASRRRLLRLVLL